MQSPRQSTKHRRSSSLAQVSCSCERDSSRLRHWLLYVKAYASGNPPRRVGSSPSSAEVPPGKRARQLENPSVRGPIESNAQRYAALAEKLEAARKRTTTR